jgi:Fe-S-cluster formation regulator IscX/YfhJ
MSRKILHKVLSGLADRNIRFKDMRKLLNELEFFERIKGDHHRKVEGIGWR